MKIALLSFEYPPETGFGGIGTYTWYHARALARLGHEVHVLAGATSATPLRRDTHDGVVVYRYAADGALMRAFGWLGHRGLWWTQNRLQNGLSMFRGLTALLERQGYDIVEMPECGAEGWLISHLVPARTVVRFHSPSRLIMGFYDVRAADVALCSWVERLAMHGASAFTSCSAFLASEVQTGLGIRRPVSVIPNGIDLDLFDRVDTSDVRRQHGLPPGRPIILFTGRMERRKGIHLCPDIVGRILARHDVAFVFAGRDLFGFMADTLLPSLQGRALRGSMHYLGDLDLAGVRACLRQADMFVLPSLWENCPYSCLEAMAAGRAIVCANQGGMPELIEDEIHGLLADPGDAGSFVSQIERLIEDRALRDRLGAAARARVERDFTDVRIAERSVAFYQRCLGAPETAVDGPSPP